MNARRSDEREGENKSYYRAGAANIAPFFYVKCAFYWLLGFSLSFIHFFIISLFNYLHGGVSTQYNERQENWEVKKCTDPWMLDVWVCVCAHACVCVCGYERETRVLPEAPIDQIIAAEFPSFPSSERWDWERKWRNGCSGQTKRKRDGNIDAN